MYYLIIQSIEKYKTLQDVYSCLCHFIFNIFFPTACGYMNYRHTSLFYKFIHLLAVQETSFWPSSLQCHGGEISFWSDLSCTPMRILKAQWIMICFPCKHVLLEKNTNRPKCLLLSSLDTFHRMRSVMNRTGFLEHFDLSYFTMCVSEMVQPKMLHNLNWTFKLEPCAV